MLRSTQGKQSQVVSATQSTGLFLPGARLSGGSGGQGTPLLLLLKGGGGLDLGEEQAATAAPT